MTAQPTRDRLRALVDETSPGPWESILSLAWGEQYPALSIQPVDEAWDQDPAHPCCAPLEEADVEFIAAARTAVPQLLDQLDQQEAELDSWMARAYEAEKRAWQAEKRIAEEKRLRMKATAAATEAEARIKAVEDLCDDADKRHASVLIVTTIRRALDT